MSAHDTMASLEANGPALKEAVASVIPLLAEGGFERVVGEVVERVTTLAAKTGGRRRFSWAGVLRYCYVCCFIRGRCLPGPRRLPRSKITPGGGGKVARVRAVDDARLHVLRDDLVVRVRVDAR